MLAGNSRVCFHGKVPKISIRAETMKTVVLSFLWLALTVACDGAESKPLDFLSTGSVNEFLAARFAAKKIALFSSRDGNHYGMDSDALIAFGPGGKVVLEEFGVAPMGYGGNYSVQEGGTITVVLKGYRGKWPPMKMARDGKTLRLYNATGSTGLIMGGRGGATETGSMKSFWPFRQVKDDGMMPSVSPVSSGGGVRSFVSPVLPNNFVWKGNKIAFRVDFEISAEGAVTVEKYWMQDTPSGQLQAKDWRLPAVKCAMNAVSKWSFYPHKEDDKPTKYSGRWEFEVRRKDDTAHWKVMDDIITVFDNMPRDRNEE
jgi:hypothetical protein